MLSRRALIRRSAEVAGSLLFADLLGLDRLAVAFGATYQVAPYYRTQFDGSYCCGCNCGMASAAMLRSTISQNAYNPSGASVRMWWNHYYYGTNCENGTYTERCTVSDSCYQLGYKCPDSTTPQAHAYNAITNPEDGGPVYNVGNYNQLSWTNFTNDLKPSGGFSAVVAGDYSKDPYPCDSFVGGHSVYVLGCDSTGSNFTVYDPDNSNGCSQPKTWSASQLTAFAASVAGSGWVTCILGRAN